MPGYNLPSRGTARTIPIFLYCSFVSFCVLFVCKCVLYNCHWVATHLQLTNISKIVFLSQLWECLLFLQRHINFNAGLRKLHVWCPLILGVILLRHDTTWFPPCCIGLDIFLRRAAWCRVAAGMLNALAAGLIPNWPWCISSKAYYKVRIWNVITIWINMQGIRILKLKKNECIIINNGITFWHLCINMQVAFLWI